MPTATIKYYPVGNGDCSLLTLGDSTTLLIDCNIRESSKGDADDTKFDVKADLLASLKKRTNDAPFVDVFVLTHGDRDHCHGFAKNFYQGDPAKYSKTDQEDYLIIMDEIWFSPMVEEISTNDDEDAFEAEAMRRIKLHRDKSADCNKPGNRVVIIGYDGKDSFQDLDHLRQVPGSVVKTFNGKAQATFSMFVHAPFKEQLHEYEERDKNYTSIVLQARFKQQATDVNYSCLAMFGGDADHYAWCVILTKTKKYRNHVKEQALNWDLFLAPHHCSWSYFNDRPYENNPDPKEEPLEVLDFHRPGARVIASCKEILDNDDNPPHYQARQQYVDKVGEDKLLNTATYQFIGSTPQPIVFEVTAQGPVFAKLVEGTAAVAGAASLGALNSVSKYGAQAL